MATKLLTAAGGGVTLDAASTATDKTITIPAADGTMALTSQLNGFRNRIINGAMVIDQRNAGASVTVSVDNIYAVDRFPAGKGGSVNNYTVQQSSTAPTGFTKSLLATMGTGVSVGSTDYAMVGQKIEGYNVADFNLGTASSVAFTLSFWVRSSVTGTFGVSFRNNAANATWCSTYAVSSANTWEYKTVTVAAGAINSGTWTTDNTAGLTVFWDLGVGSTYSGTANQLNTGSNYFGVTGTTKLAATTGATFYITGVQLEKGSVATGFDYRPYGTELALCQRYYYRISHAASGKTFGIGQAFSSTAVGFPNPFPVTMRTAPTALEQNGTAANYYVLNAGGGSLACSAVPAFNSATNADIAWTNFTAASGLVAGNATGIWTGGAAYLGWSAEL